MTRAGPVFFSGIVSQAHGGRVTEQTPDSHSCHGNVTLAASKCPSTTLTRHPRQCILAKPHACECCTGVRPRVDQEATRRVHSCTRQATGVGPEEVQLTVGALGLSLHHARRSQGGHRSSACQPDEDRSIYIFFFIHVPVVRRAHPHRGAEASGGGSVDSVIERECGPTGSATCPFAQAHNKRAHPHRAAEARWPGCVGWSCGLWTLYSVLRASVAQLCPAQ